MIAIPKTMPKRHVILPDRGTLLVNTDIHGHFEDFRRLRTLFEQAQRDDPAGAHWVILGDIVHGPDDIARGRNPVLYGYPDESVEIVRGIVAVQQAYAGRV